MSRRRTRLVWNPAAILAMLGASILLGVFVYTMLNGYTL